MTRQVDEHTKKIAEIVFMFFGLVVLSISALTSFSFFYVYFPNLVPSGLLDSQVSQIISGAIGIILFDLASAVWLTVFLSASETSEQRAIALLLTVISFVGAGSASIAYLVLSATGELSLGDETKQSIAMFALVVVLVGVIANFGAGLAHKRYSKANKDQVRENKFQDKIQKLDDENRDNLFTLIESEMREAFKDVAPQIALKRAQKIIDDFVSAESVQVTHAKSDTSEPKPEGEPNP